MRLGMNRFLNYMICCFLKACSQIPIFYFNKLIKDGNYSDKFLRNCFDSDKTN